MAFFQFLLRNVDYTFARRLAVHSSARHALVYCVEITAERFEILAMPNPVVTVKFEL